MQNKQVSVMSALLMAGALLFAGLVAAQNYPPAVSELVAQTKTQITRIDMATFKSAFDKGDLGLIVDVREPAGVCGWKFLERSTFRAGRSNSESGHMSDSQAART